MPQPAWADVNVHKAHANEAVNSSRVFVVGTDEAEHTHTQRFLPQPKQL